jgi:type IV secretory pathway component VirB8
MNQILKSRPLREEEQESFHNHTLSFLGEIKAVKKEAWYDRRFLSLGSFVLGLGCLGVATALYIDARNNPPKTFYAAVDVTTGFISLAVGAADAPELYNKQTDWYWVNQYVQNWHSYTWETDQAHFNAVQLMSSDAQRARYAEWHKSPLAPAQALGRHGYVVVSNLRIEPKSEGRAKTLEYTVYFDRIEIKDAQVGPTEHWSGNIQFQWHPELVLSDQQRLNNLGGMVVTFFDADRPNAQ